MSKNFISIEDLNIDKSIAKKIFESEESSKKFYEARNSDWLFGFSQEIYRNCIRVFKYEKNYKEAYPYLRESRKIFKYLDEEYRHNFQNTKFFKYLIKRRTKIIHYYDFCYWMLDSNSINSLVLDLIRNDLFKTEKYSSKTTSKEYISISKPLTHLCKIIRYHELDNLKFNKNDFIKEIKDSKIFKSGEHNLIESISSNNSNVDYIDICNFVLYKLFLNESEFINNQYFLTLHKHFFEIHHRIRDEVFDDLENLNYKKYQNNNKLRLLYNIKKIDYKSCKRRYETLLLLKKNEDPLYEEEMKYQKTVGRNNLEDLYVEFLSEKNVCLYYQILLQGNQKNSNKVIESFNKNVGEINKTNMMIDKSYNSRIKYNVIMSIAHFYQFLGLTNDDIYLGHEFLLKATIMLKDIKSKKSFYMSIFTNYIQILKYVKESKKPEIFASHVRHLKEKYLDPKTEEQENYQQMLPRVSRDILKVINITSLIGANDAKSLNILFERIQIDSDSKSFVFDRSQLARLVMAYNLLSSSLESEERKVIFSAVKSFMLERKIKLLNYEKKSDKEKPNSQLLNDLNLEESKSLEYKGSWGLNIRRFIYDPEKEKDKSSISNDKKINYDVLKNIAAMQNTDGGRIYIGILEVDDKKITDKMLSWLDKEKTTRLKNKYLLGIDSELNISNKNLDQYMRDIEEKIQLDIDEKSLEYVDIYPHGSVGEYEKTILCINISPRYDEGGAWFDNKFFWRTHKSARSKKGNEAMSYLNRRRNIYNEKIEIETNKEKFNEGE